MNDKQIRCILIEYLKATSKEIRIYQEKSIGSSVCDVMAVTDILTGYEIKSDTDNYQRLDGQVAAYSRFFDENYLVVSRQHAKSAASRVPDDWGILCIYDDSVSAIRKAKRNNRVSRRAQLSILWKLELKNLLIKNNLPLYPLKTKDYISCAIAEKVDPSELGRQIAMELMRRDYSVYGAEDLTIHSEHNNDFPQNEIVDALSERDLTEFSLDKWIELYRMAKEVQAVKEEAFRTAPAARQPHAIPYTDIEVSLGAPYIDEQIIRDFISEVFCSRSRIGVFHEPITGNWSIPYKRSDGNLLPVGIQNKFGIPRYNPLFILEATLNLREIRLFDENNEFRDKDTIATLEKQKQMKQAFRDWIWLDEDRRWQVEEAYNELFARYGKIPSDGRGLKFPEMNPEQSLFPYQKDAVQRIIDRPNTLLAFDVGAGKTYIMIAAAMKLRQQGLSRKNMFVVPNNIVGQWEDMFVKLYPKAQVLAIEPKSFKPELRRKVLEQIRDGDYDGIIIAYSCFEQIQISTAAVYNNLEHSLKQINDAVKTMFNQWAVYKKLSGEADRIKKTIKEYVDKMDLGSPTGTSFEELEITGLFLDEAHNYKNLPIHTHLKNLSGINTKGSLKCMDMLQKIRCVQANGRGVVFATGTPLCNSISDVFAMQMYLQYDELERTHLNVFDNWVKMFAEPEQLFEIDVTVSSYRMVRRFSRFFNLPELSRMFSQIAVFYALDESAELPELEECGEVVIEPYPELSGYMQELVERTERIRNKDVHPSKDNMLKVSTDGRKAALDLTLVKREQPDGAHSKVCRCVETAMDIYGRYPNSTQLIFCDYSTPKGDDFSVYRELKDRLCAAGVQPKEIAFIHSYGTELRKLELFRKFNAGEVRFIIGSTFKLGIGANVQKKLKAIHHLDVPWRPADMIQREGRILRRGNENERVHVFRYIAEGSFDAYSWQILERKQRFISQFLTGSAYQRSASDLEDNVLTYAEVKALALADPVMKELAEKENELKNLHILHNHELSVRRAMEEELADIETRLPIMLCRAEGSRANAEYATLLGTECIKKAIEMVVDSPEWEDLSSLHCLKTPLCILEFTIRTPEKQDDKKPYALIGRNGVEYKLELGSSKIGNARKVTNLLKKLDSFAKKDQEDYESALSRKAELKSQIDKQGSEYEEKIKEYEDEVARIQRLLRSKTE